MPPSSSTVTIEPSQSPKISKTSSTPATVFINLTRRLNHPPHINDQRQLKKNIERRSMAHSHQRNPSAAKIGRTRRNLIQGWPLKVMRNHWQPHRHLHSNHWRKVAAQKQGWIIHPKYRFIKIQVSWSPPFQSRTPNLSKNTSAPSPTKTYPKYSSILRPNNSFSGCKPSKEK